MAKSNAKVTVVLSQPKPKNHVVRYDAAEDDSDAAMKNGYISNAAIKELGNPKKVKITIEAA